jgi:hypothetical protein
VFEVLLAHLVRNVVYTDQILSVRFQLIDDLFHASSAGLMFEVVSQHFENNLQHREEILFAFEAF